MKLIREENFSEIDSITVIEEEVKDSNGKPKKNVYIEGVFLQANIKNRNGRIYEDKVLRPAVDKYINEQVATGRAVGELGHPETNQINLDRVSHRTVSLYWLKDDVIGKALVLNTPTGIVVKGLLEGGVKLGVSSRGVGSLIKGNGMDYVQDDFALSTIDIVADPSANKAFVNGILEGVDWVYTNGNLTPRSEEALMKKRKRIKESFKNSISADEREAIQLKEFADFIKGLL